MLDPSHEACRARVEREWEGEHGAETGRVLAEEGAEGSASVLW